MRIGRSRCSFGEKETKGGFAFFPHKTQVITSHTLTKQGHHLSAIAAKNPLPATVTHWLWYWFLIHSVRSLQQGSVCRAFLLWLSTGFLTHPILAEDDLAQSLCWCWMKHRPHVPGSRLGISRCLPGLPSVVLHSLNKTSVGVLHHNVHNLQTTSALFSLLSQSVLTLKTLFWGSSSRYKSTFPMHLVILNLPYNITVVVTVVCLQRGLMAVPCVWLHTATHRKVVMKLRARTGTCPHFSLALLAHHRP